MLKSGKEVLLSYPIPVWFAGFKSTTAELQHNGWQFSMREEFGYRRQLSLAMQLESAGLFAITAPIDFFAMELFFQLDKGNTQVLKELQFNVIHCGNRVQFHRIPVQGNAFLSEFTPIDCQPQMSVLESPEDFALFRKLDKMKDVLIDPNDVPGLMELVLKAQRPAQELIRARQKSRENLSKWREMQNGRANPSFDFQPATEIKAQILTLVG